ncbi:hypothetical protein CA850_09035 [Micromonospora echinospora]|uniref:Uncharacterized protein n=1 Tax=Micromonospora echinospora TaxID=1877 RepID=A0A1C4XH00_MICEC|nr:hypothetical protein [Micromonospora echinospora]OZV82417.1 hypothetical protein CA850_09035 [Micromonospora echinospora]SCF07715.1 hypothetical protein GA0070618_3046 [Micromonospora echinospora]
MGAHAGAVRELLVVLVVAGVGLLLALLAAFGPWHPGVDDRHPAVVVELHSPVGVGTGGVADNAG